MKIKKVILVGILSLSAGAAQAGSCGYQYCWGTVMIGPNGASSYSYGYGSEQGAYERAMQECRYNCDTYRTFANACAAIAQGTNGYWGWGQAQSQYDAEATALGYCSEGANDCQVRVWACSF